MTDTTEPSFGKIRSLLWPVRSHELNKVIPLFCLFFLVTFVYNLLRCMKDTLIVTSASVGVQAIPFIKLWAMLPSAFLLTYLFAKLSNVLSREKVFYAMLSFFLSFFAIFAFWLYPIHLSLKPQWLLSFLSSHLSPGLAGFIAMIEHWPFTLFYVMSEMWGVIMLSMLLWGFTNEILKMREAKRFYAIFSLGINASGIFSGLYASYLCTGAFGCSSWEESFRALISTILICGGLIFLLFFFINQQYSSQKKSTKTKKTRLSLRESFRLLIKSPYLGHIAIMVLSYNIVFNLIDVHWKHSVYQVYQDPSQFNAYMNKITSIQGLLATFISLFLSGAALRILGWTTSALITPVIMLITSLCVFPMILAHQGGIAWISLGMITLLSSAQICLSRASKYTFFDNTKEMAFIPLDRSSQRKGKAAIDGVGSRLGKSGGSLIYQILFLFFPTFAATTPFVASIILICIAFWLSSTLKLGKSIQASSSPH